MIPNPHHPYFLVRTSRKEEKEYKSKIGSFIMPETVAFMGNNTQCGEIVKIGNGAAAYFPESKIGYTLFFHHFVQSTDENDAKQSHLIHWDEEFNYYVVTAYEYGGKGNETYGVWDGEKIIPNKDYVFLEMEKPPVNDLPPDEAVNQALQKTEGGLFIFSQWKETREQKEARQAELKKEAQELSKSGTNKLHIQQGIKMKEWEMEAISRDINAQTYLPYTIAYCNSQLSEWFDKGINAGDTVGMLNHACQTTLNIFGKELIVAKTKFIAYLFNQEKVA